ncbi:MAG: MarR family transcriptional regulator [Atopobiaceae bacterium]|nr:MarR family transcriptional regulator [Atopobiaceae bacterium]
MREGVKLGRLIKVINQKFEREKNALVRELGITNAQIELLDYLSEHTDEGVTQRDLAEHGFVSRAAVTGMVSRLEEKGLVERIVGTDDRRTNVVRLTKAAMPLVDTCAQRLEGMDELLTAELTEGERIELVRLLNKLIS